MTTLDKEVSMDSPIISAAEAARRSREALDAQTEDFTAFCDSVRSKIDAEIAEAVARETAAGNLYAPLRAIVNKYMIKASTADAANPIRPGWRRDCEGLVKTLINANALEAAGYKIEHEDSRDYYTEVVLSWEHL